MARCTLCAPMSPPRGHPSIHSVCIPFHPTAPEDPHCLHHLLGHSSHQVSIDSTTSLTCSTTIFISFHANLIPPFLLSSHFSPPPLHLLSRKSQPTWPPTDQPPQATHSFLPGSSHSAIQSFRPSTPRTCNSNSNPNPIHHRHLFLGITVSCISRRTLNSAFRLSDIATGAYHKS